MSPRFHDDDVDAVRERTDIVEIISEHVRLKRSGRNYMGLCPFHQEKTPSLSVDRDRGLYYCLAGETRVITEAGVREIHELAGATHRILTTGGWWTEAPFFSFGVQALDRITLSRNGIEKVVHATPEHRWLVHAKKGRRKRREVRTRGLRPGHSLSAAYPLGPSKRSRARLLTPSPPADSEGELPEVDLLGDHRRRFEGHAKAYGRRRWVVRSVERTDRREEVFCPVVEGTHAFVLEDNILTGNCHGCGAGGNVFTFVEEVEALTFPEAVETLAARYGVQLREVSGGGKRQESPRRRLLALHEAAVEHYRKSLLLPEGEPVGEYLEERGITPEIAERHKVGFGGWAKDGLLTALVRKGFTAQELNAAGLAVGDRRGARDMFFGRLLFPIFDPSDRPVGFGGRVLPEEHRGPGAPDAPKYINSRETPLFKKSRVLYGANWARGEVVQKRRLVLVEGYTDVIALHAAGVGEAVATCGTSLTEDHMKEISTRFGDVRVVLCLDADAAGQQAMSRERTEELAERFSAGGHLQGGVWLPVGRGWLPEVYVANLPDEADPADFVAAEGAEGLERLLADPTPLVRFVLNRALAGEDLGTPEGRTRAVRKAADVLAQVGDPLLRHEYALWVAGVVGVEPYEVTRTVESRTKTDRGRRSREEPAGPEVLSGQHRVEREALRALIHRGELLGEPDLGPGEEDFSLPVHRSLFRLLRADHDRGEGIDPGRLASRVQEPDVRRALGEISSGEPSEEDAAREVLRRLKGFSLGRRIEERKVRLRALDPDRERHAYDTLFEELLQLETERRALGRASGG